MTGVFMMTIQQMGRQLGWVEVMLMAVPLCFQDSSCPFYNVPKDFLLLQWINIWVLDIFGFLNLDIFEFLINLTSWYIWILDLFKFLRYLTSWYILILNLIEFLIYLTSWFIWILDIFEFLIYLNSRYIWHLDILEFLISSNSWYTVCKR